MIMRIRKPIEVIGRDPELTMKIMTAIGRRTSRTNRRRGRWQKVLILLTSPSRFLGWLTRKLQA